MNNLIFSPSIMCVDIGDLKSTLKQLEEAKVDLIHIDIMDGYFVPNISLSKNDVNSIVKNTVVPFDLHLMVEHPLLYLDYLSEFKAEIIYFHIESNDEPLDVIEKIKSNGSRVGIAINPETPIERISKYIEYIDDLLIMTVHPGFSGSTYIEDIDLKIKQINDFNVKNDNRMTLHIDGAITEEKIKQHIENGVKGYVLGTKTLFNKNESYSKIINRLRKY